MDIMSYSPKKKPAPGMEIEVEMGPAEDRGLSFDDEKVAKVEDPLAQFDDEEILKALEARPTLLEILKKKIMGEEAPAEEAPPVEEEEDESAMTPVNAVGTI